VALGGQHLIGFAIELQQPLNKRRATHSVSSGPDHARSSIECGDAFRAIIASLAADGRRAVVGVKAAELARILLESPTAVLRRPFAGADDAAYMSFSTGGADSSAPSIVASKNSCGRRNCQDRRPLGGVRAAASARAPGVRPLREVRCPRTPDPRRPGPVLHRQSDNPRQQGGLAEPGRH